MNIMSSSTTSSSASSNASVYLNGHTPAAAWYEFSRRTITLVSLPILSLIGAFGTWGLGSRNGTFEHIFNTIAQESPVFPNSQALLLKRYTCVAPIDQQLAVLVMFFAPIVDKTPSVIRLFSIFGLGQFGAAWTLLVMESLRSGNKGRIVSFIGTTGMLMQNITYTVTVPIYLFIHLITSPVAKPFPGTHANSVLLIPSLDLKILPFSIILGFIVPSILMGLEFPLVVSAPTHQKLIAFWQIFPIWTMFLQWLMRSSCQFIAKQFASHNTHQHTPAPQGASYLRNAKYVYRFVLTLCMVTHIPALLISLYPSWAVPDTMPKLAVYAQYSFLDVFIPAFPLLGYRVPDLGAGSLIFLQWDLIVGSIAFLVWAVFLYRNATAEKTIVVDPDTNLPKYGELLAGEVSKAVELRRKVASKIILWTIVAGPIGALTILLWERDEIVRQKIKQGM